MHAPVAETRSRLRRSLLPCLLLAALLLPACRHRAAATTPRAAPGTAAPQASWYEAGGSPGEADSIETLWREDHNELLRVAVPARVPADLELYPNYLKGAGLTVEASVAAKS